MLAANKMNPDSQQKYNTLQQQSHYECFYFTPVTVLQKNLNIQIQ